MTREAFEVPDLIPGESMESFRARVAALAEKCGWIVKSVSADEVVITKNYGTKIQEA